jgi:NTP pyrophosphatase (non-canonical NTP hydrolase)
MKRTEHLLFKLAEEAAEVAQRASKAARFGVTEIQPGQHLNNAERMLGELLDVQAVVEMLYDAGVLPARTDFENRAHIDAHKVKVERFLEYSRQCGTLTE